MTIEMLIARYGLVVLFLGAGIEGETVVVTGGLLAHQGLVPLGWAMAAAGAGSFVADQLFFAAGRHYRDHPRVKRIAARPAFAKALGLLERWPTAFIFGFRFLYGLRTVSPIAIGTTHVPTRKFLAINAVAAAAWGAGFTTLGYVFGESIEKIFGKVRSAGHVILYVAAGALLVAGIVWGVRRIRLRQG